MSSSWSSDIHSHVTFQLREVAQEFILVDIGTILSLAPLIPEGDWRSLVNTGIDLRMFNEIY